LDRFEVPATARTPAVSFDFVRHHLKLSGESYPEDVTTFFNPIFEALDDYLAGLSTGRCRFDFELIYFNSSSAKAIMMLLEKLDEAAEGVSSVSIHWYFDSEDDTMQELGEEFGEDLVHAGFQVEEMAADA
jgi:hypothetical protein